MEGQFVCDLLDRLLRESKLLAGILDLQLVEVFNGREARALPEDGGEMGNGEMGVIGKFVQREIAVELLLHQFDGIGDGIIGLRMFNPVILLFIQQGGKEVLEHHVRIPQVLDAVAVLQVDADLLKQLDAVLIIGEVGYIVLGITSDEVHEKTGNVSFEVDPVNSPWIFIVHAILVRGVGRYHNEIPRGDVHLLFIDAHPALTLHAIDDDMLADAMGPVHIMLLGLRIIANIRNIDLFGDRVFFKEPRI